jgi:O-antigen ligase
VQHITSQDSAEIDLHYNDETSEKEYLGLQGYVLIFCVFELFIALFFPVFKVNIKGITELNLIIYILLFLSAIHIVIKRGKPSFHRHDFIILIYLIYCMFSVGYSYFYNGYPFKKELFALKNWMNPIVIYFLIKNSIENRKQAIALSNSLTIILVLSSAISLIGYFLMPDIFATRGRVAGVVGQSNLFGMFIVTLSPLLFLTIDPRKKIIKFISIAIVMIALIQTGSRGAFLGQFIVLVLILYKKRHKINAVKVGVFVILGFLLVLSLPLFQGQDVFTRFKKADNEDLSGYSHGRLNAWPLMLKEYSKKPILGYGFNSFSREFSIKYTGKPFATHNEYIDILFTLGIIGFLLFVLIFYNIWKVLKKNDDLLIACACRYGIMGYFVHITFSNPNQTRYFFWLIVAITLRFIELNEKKKTTP